MMRDPWHIGELPGDDGRTIRDQNGLTVRVAATEAKAHEIVDAHNASEKRDADRNRS